MRALWGLGLLAVNPLGPLFELPMARCRTSDPVTSADAADAMCEESLAQAVMIRDVVRRGGVSGYTAKEIAAIISAEQHYPFFSVQVSRRISAMRDVGWIVTLDGKKYGNEQYQLERRDGCCVIVAREFAVNWRMAA